MLPWLIQGFYFFTVVMLRNGNVVFLTHTLYLWCKLRVKYKSKDFSYEIIDIKNRIIFNSIMVCTITIPVILILYVTILLLYYFVNSINVLLQLDFNKLIISFSSMIILILFFSILFLILFEKILSIIKLSFSEYDRICLEFNIKNEKIIMKNVMKIICILYILFIHVFLFTIIMY